jgi:hypothetical protein
MPGILTMIQVDRSTPAPSVIIVTVLSLLYLTSRYFIETPASSPVHEHKKFLCPSFVMLTLSPSMAQEAL